MNEKDYKIMVEGCNQKLADVIKLLYKLVEEKNDKQLLFMFLYNIQRDILKFMELTSTLDIDVDKFLDSEEPLNE